MIVEFERHLRGTNLAENTVKSYLFAVRQFYTRYDSVTKRSLKEHKAWLIEQYKPKTVNLRIRAINCYLESIGKSAWALSSVKVQQKAFLENVISEADYTYVKTNRQFAEKAGWPLFLELDEQDRYNFEGLRIPINNSIVEMDMLVLSLVKVLLDSLNEKEIVSHLTGTYEKLVGSISKLEVWFQEKQLTGYQDHIKFLRNLQELRSSGTGHRKGKSYQKISKVFDIQKENYTETFSNILESATLFLNYISTHIEELSK